MGDSDDVMKLNKEDLFGDDSTQDSESHPEASPLPAAETVPPVEIPVENEIKFNDLTNKPTIAPMIRMQKKGMRGVVLDLGFGAGQPAGPIPKSTERNQTGLNAGNAAGQSTHSE
ncbi:MAG TPA: hypothetical protein VN963_08140 [bacterium]|nr:hypothetical protein [bacterium]